MGSSWWVGWVWTGWSSGGSRRRSATMPPGAGRPGPHPKSPGWICTKCSTGSPRPGSRTEWNLRSCALGFDEVGGRLDERLGREDRARDVVEVEFGERIVVGQRPPLECIHQAAMMDRVESPRLGESLPEPGQHTPA